VTDEANRVSVLFVCMGNICRSPTAQGVFEYLAAARGLDDRIVADSAGTHAYHVGEPPDGRSAAAARRRGIDLSAQRARRVADEDFARFDLVVAMDRDNLQALRARCPYELADRLHLMLSFAADAGVTDVPDPYYGGASGFEQVLDLVEQAADGLLDRLENRLEAG